MHATKSRSRIISYHLGLSSRQLGGFEACGRCRPLKSGRRWDSRWRAFRQAEPFRPLQHVFHRGRMPARKSVRAWLQVARQSAAAECARALVAIAAMGSWPAQAILGNTRSQVRRDLSSRIPRAASFVGRARRRQMRALALRSASEPHCHRIAHGIRIGWNDPRSPRLMHLQWMMVLPGVASSAASGSDLTAGCGKSPALTLHCLQCIVVPGRWCRTRCESPTRVSVAGAGAAARARRVGAMALVENGERSAWLSRRLLRRGTTRARPPIRSLLPESRSAARP